MASKRAKQRAVRALAYDDAMIEALADKLFQAKRRIYRNTLLELARSLGREIDRPQLSEAVIDQLRQEADNHARQVARTFNRDLARQAAEYAGPDSRVNNDLSRWRNARNRRRAKPLAVHESYTAHADAVLSFVHDLEIEPDFIFGFHPDDAPPACSICQALEATKPHTLAEVVEVGTPHIHCRQNWRLSGVDARTLPFEWNFGQTPGGIVGGESFLQRHGNDRDAAARAISQTRR